jgi:hypothetical protein
VKASHLVKENPPIETKNSIKDVTIKDEVAIRDEFAKK